MRFSRRGLFVVLVLLVALGCLRLRFDVQILNLLPPHLKVVEGLKLYQEHFSNNRELIVTLTGTNTETAEAAVESLANALRSDSNSVESVRWRPVWFEDPSLSAELLGYIWFNQQPSDFRALADRLSPTNLVNVLESTKEKLATSFSPTDLARLAYDPYGLTDLPASTTSQIPTSMRDQNWFASDDGTFRVMFVQARASLTNYRDCIAWVNHVHDLAQQWKEKNPAYAGMRIAYTGPPAFVAEASQGMQHDLTESVMGTMVLIGLLFWVAYRRWLPLFWILILLTMVLAGALALGGVFMGTLNVISLGFAGILLGITADYALVLYQASLANPGLTPATVRGKVRGGILWSAVTTGGAFLVLRSSGFPGLAQLGTLVALGIAFGAIMILTFFLEPLKRAAAHSKVPRLPAFTRQRAFAVGASVAVILFVAAGWIYKLPALDYTGNALEPANSEAYAGLKEMERKLNQPDEPYIALVRGKSEEDVLKRLNALDKALTEAKAQKQIASFMLPTLLWPRPASQIANRETARLLAGRQKLLRETALTNGFSTNALVLADALLNTWRRAAESTNVFWPDNELSRWILQKVVARETNGYLAMGAVYPRKDISAGAAAKWSHQLPQDETWLTGWQPLAGELLRTMSTRIVWMLGGVLVLLVVALWLAFGRWIEVVLSFVTLGLSGLLLCALMQFSGWSWNLMNIMALPLLLGAGVDYTILMQLALRRHRGDVAAVHHEIGVALVVSCATAAVGFGSLAWASNAGLASLGRVCAAGIIGTGFVAIFLLPFWWRRFANIEGQISAMSSPPKIYRAAAWKFGLMAVRVIPQGLLYWLAETLAVFYAATHEERREVVIKNLLPVVNGNRELAEVECRRLFRNFGQKLVDLWRCEAGLPSAPLIAEFIGADTVLKAHERKQGVLLVTPHLGNWEVGGYALADRGIKLRVVTLAEPAEGLTELRSEARERQGIETIVVGSDPFTFVQIIKLLQEGAVMALLLDRPQHAVSTTVELFGKPFRAALAAAELARASGCAIVPVFLPRTKKGYRIELAPEIAYNRNELGDREARHRLTQQIMGVFETAIRQYPNQWYHFVPIWPDDAKQ
jgi:predicted exporter/lauroyl/myristoyl acyltransferase